MLRALIQYLKEQYWRMRTRRVHRQARRHLDKNGSKVLDRLQKSYSDES